MTLTLCFQALHTPVVNVPGLKGSNDMPIGISLVAPRYRDRHLLKVSRAVGQVLDGNSASSLLHSNTSSQLEGHV